MKVFIRKVLEHLYGDFYHCSKLRLLLLEKSIDRKLAPKNIWLFGIPKSRNLGDQAQVYCSEKWFNENYPGHRIFMFNSNELLCKGCSLLDHIAKVIKKDDIVFFQSGYNLTDMYPFQERMHREVTKRVLNNKVIFLPQTISFEAPYAENAFLKDGEDIYKAHPNVFLLCRDEKSYKIAQQAMPYIKEYPFPDIVTTLIGRYDIKSKKRSGVMLCVRSDRESSLSEASKMSLIKDLGKDFEVELNDTTIEYPAYQILAMNRKKHVFAMIDRMSQKEVIVTDRYHGLIFAVVSGTPVILIKTIDHKLTEGIRWFPEEMRKNIYLASDVGEICEIACKIKADKTIDYAPYFYEQYYKNLKGIIDEHFDSAKK